MIKFHSLIYCLTEEFLNIISFYLLIKRGNMERKGVTSTVVILLIVIFLIVLCVFIGFFIYFKMNESSNNPSVIIVANPMNGIVQTNTQYGVVNQSAAIEQGVLNFNESYISYLLNSLGTSNLHKSNLGYGNPKIEIIMGQETWNSELGDTLIIMKNPSDDPDIRVRMSKEEAVRALLSPDIKQYMKDDVTLGKIQIDMIAGKVELYSKGYLEMYNKLTQKNSDD